MLPAIALITTLLIGSAGANGNVAQVAAPTGTEKMDSNLRGTIPVANAAENIHAPPDWHPPSTSSGTMAFAALFLIPIAVLAGMKNAKDLNHWVGPCCLVATPIFIFFVYTCIVALFPAAFQ